MAISLLLKRSMVALLLALVLSACHRQPVRHFSSDVSLLLPGSTTKQEVLASWGAPEQRQLASPQGETWIYYQVNKSFLRKAPLLGGKMGREQYEVAIITFQGEVVRSCTYRSFNEQEFERAGISRSEPTGH
jgi:hypothetical protein